MQMPFQGVELVECNHPDAIPVNGERVTIDESMLLNSLNGHNGVVDVDELSEVHNSPGGVGLQPERQTLPEKLKELSSLSQQLAMSSINANLSCDPIDATMEDKTSSGNAEALEGGGAYKQPSLLEGDKKRKDSIEMAYNAALRKVAKWPSDGIAAKMFEKICIETGVQFKRGEKNWIGDPIVHKMALELFVRTNQAYTPQQLHNKWKNMKINKKLEEDHQKLDAEENNEVAMLHENHDKLEIELAKEVKEKMVYKEQVETLQKEVVSLKEKVDLLKQQLYTAEVLRSQMHNEIMEMKGSIRVFCRIRPVLDNSISAICYPDKGPFVGRRVYLSKETGAIRVFTCDRVFPPTSSQREIFLEISGLVKSALDGKKVSIFAYGQTGSGKTYTMLGEDGDEKKGVIPRVVEEIFEAISEEKSLLDHRYTIKIGAIEVYNEEVRDLSSGDSVVKTKTQALKALKEALSKRVVAKTSRNERSSRSHLIFTLSIQFYNKEMELCEGVLNIVDLAGSESSDSGATKETKDEAMAINRSLLYLGTTIADIERGAEFVNFRNSALTKQLQSSLGKNCKVLMFVNVASEKSCAKESSATFEYAARIKPSIKMDTMDSKKMQAFKENRFEFKSPGMSSLRLEKAAVGLNPPFSVNHERINKQGPYVAPSCRKRLPTMERGGAETRGGAQGPGPP